MSSPALRRALRLLRLYRVPAALKARRALNVRHKNIAAGVCVPRGGRLLLLINMEGIKVNAVMLRSADYGENDKMLTLLTAELGKISAGIKGVKKAGAR